jgi:polyhydroxyalkanoate synthesis regulator phasin
MALIKEPIDVDFFVESQPLTNEEKRLISDFIAQYKKEKKEVEKKKSKKKENQTPLAQSVSS